MRGAYQVSPAQERGSRFYEGLRKLLGKDDKTPYNDDDCQKVASLLADEIAEEFGETLANIIANRT